MKVGIFDSGLGGLTVVQALLKVIKGADFYYIADTLYAPYGAKSTTHILEFSLNIAHYFIQKHQIDVLIIACNTATSASIEILRAYYPQLIIIGTEPGIKPAIEKSKTAHVGVLATPATLEGEKYKSLADTLCETHHVTLYESSCPGLVEQIENDEVNSPKTKEMLTSWLSEMKENNVDTIVLGCTHYPLVSHVIEEIMQRDLTLVDTGDAIAKRLLLLATQRLGHKNEGEVHICFYATGPINSKIISHILGQDVKVEKIQILE